MAVEYFSLSSAGKDEILYITPPGGAEAAPDMALSSKNAGTMGPSYDFTNENRLRLFRKMEVSPENVVGLRQEHTKTVHVLHKDGGKDVADNTPIGDGLLTDDRETALVVTVADCLPIFLHHAEGVPFGILHSGWKGTGIVRGAVEKLKENFGISPSRIHAVIGPGIGACCYKVDASRTRYFAENFGKNTVTEEGGLDLRQANINILGELGVEEIHVCTTCTFCSPCLGSFRREGPESFTRMIALTGFLL